jgi:hypothetical protein
LGVLDTVDDADDEADVLTEHEKEDADAVWSGVRFVTERRGNTNDVAFEADVRTGVDSDDGWPPILTGVSGAVAALSVAGLGMPLELAEWGSGTGEAAADKLVRVTVGGCCCCCVAAAEARNASASAASASAVAEACFGGGTGT